MWIHASLVLIAESLVLLTGGVCFFLIALLSQSYHICLGDVLLGVSTGRFSAHLIHIILLMIVLNLKTAFLCRQVSGIPAVKALLANLPLPHYQKQTKTTDTV